MTASAQSEDNEENVCYAKSEYTGLLLCDMVSRRKYLICSLAGLSAFYAGCIGSGGDAAGDTLLRVDGPVQEVDALTYGQVVEADSVKEASNGRYELPIDVTGDGAQALEDAKATSGAHDDPHHAELHVLYDGDVVSSRAVSEEFAEADVEEMTVMHLTFDERNHAEAVRERINDAN